MDSGGNNYCKYSYKTIYTPIIGWKKWDECTFFDKSEVCQTCEKFGNCDNIPQLYLADSVAIDVPYCTCKDYEPNKEMDLYIRSNILVRPKKK